MDYLRKESKNVTSERGREKVREKERVCSSGMDSSSGWW